MIVTKRRKKQYCRNVRNLPFVVDFDSKQQSVAVFFLRMDRGPVRVAPLNSILFTSAFCWLVVSTTTKLGDACFQGWNRGRTQQVGNIYIYILGGGLFAPALVAGTWYNSSSSSRSWIHLDLDLYVYCYIYDMTPLFKGPDLELFTKPSLACVCGTSKCFWCWNLVGWIMGVDENATGCQKYTRIS